MDVAIAKTNQLQETQKDALNKMIDRDAKFDNLVDKVDSLTTETKTMRSEVRLEVLTLGYICKKAKAETSMAAEILHGVVGFGTDLYPYCIFGLRVQI